MISNSRVLAIFASTLVFSSAGAQQLAMNQGPLSDDQNALGISLFSVFATITSIDEEQPGRGQEIIKHTIGVESDESASALAAYMTAGFYAVHASSAARAREFCEREINTREELLEAIEDREQHHNAELTRIVTRAADVVSGDEYDLLVQYATRRASSRTLTSIDYPATYGEGTNVSREVERRCG